MAPDSLPQANAVPETLPFRNPDVLFAMAQRFEKDWAEWLEASMRFQSHRPEGFPPEFRSRWALAWHLRTLSDQQALELQRTLSRHPYDVERDAGAGAKAERVSRIGDGARAEVGQTLTPEAAREAGFPRIWLESA